MGADDAVVMDTFARHRFDGVFHLAARAGVRPSIENPRLYFSTNMDGTLNLLEAAEYTTQSPFEILNLGGAATTTLSELIGLVEVATGCKAEIRELPDQPGDVPRTYADVSKAENLLGYRPQTAIREGIAKYVAWQVRMNTAEA